MNDNNINILSRDDGNHYYGLSEYMKHYVLKGIGDSFKATMSGLVATIGTGQGSIYGRHIINDASTTVSLPANTTGYIVLELDLTKPAGHELQAVTKTVLKQNDIANGGTNYDMPIYSFTTNASSTTIFKDMREYNLDFTTGNLAPNITYSCKKFGNGLLEIEIVATWGTVINTSQGGSIFRTNNAFNSLEYPIPFIEPPCLSGPSAVDVTVDSYCWAAYSYSSDLKRYTPSLHLFRATTGVANTHSYVISFKATGRWK